MQTKERVREYVDNLDPQLEIRLKRRRGSALRVVVGILLAVFVVALMTLNPFRAAGGSPEG